MNTYVNDKFYENDCYSNLVYDLLRENRVRLSELHRTLRIGNKGFYIYAVKKSAEFSPERMVEDLTILYEDIQALDSEKEGFLKETLADLLYSFIDPIRYHKDSQTVIAFSERIKKELHVEWQYL